MLQQKAIGAVFVSQAKHFPIDIIPYLPASGFPSPSLQVIKKN